MKPGRRGPLGIRFVGKYVRSMVERTPPDAPIGPADETLVDGEWTPGPETQVIVEEREPPPPPRRMPTLWPWLLALLVLVLGGLGAAYYFSQEDDENAPATTQTVARAEVPSVVGVREERARELIREAGLEPEVRRRAGNKPAGVVMEQQPEAGERVAEGGSVLLTVSRGPAREVVPDLIGAQLNEALDDLQKAGFESDVSQVFATELSGVVVEQEPVGGTKLEKGSAVALTVSKGPKPVPVPDVVGMQASEATAALRKAGFEVNLVPVPSQEPAGTVVAQNPAAGTLPKPGTAVRLNVAQDGSPSTTTDQTTTQGTTTSPATRPPAQAAVPDVVGLTQAQATRALHDVGLKPSLQFVPSQQDAVGTVVAQARAAGTKLRRGESVQVNVSVGPEQVPLVAVPDVVGLREREALSQLTSAGFRVQVLKETTDDPGEVGVVVDRQPERSPEGGLVTIWVGRSA